MGISNLAPTKSQHVAVCGCDSGHCETYRRWKKRAGAGIRHARDTILEFSNMVKLAIKNIKIQDGQTDNSQTINHHNNHHHFSLTSHVSYMEMSMHAH